MSEALEIRSLEKSLGQFSIKDVSFSIPKGYIMGFIGPNGAGKTTVIRLILDMLHKDSGEIIIGGRDHIKQQRQVKEEIGVVFDANIYPIDWTVRQVEKNMAPFYASWDTGRFSQLLKQFGVDSSKKVKDLSRGMQMKLMLAVALSHKAKLLVLDEPTGGLDAVSRDELMDILAAYIEDGENSVLFSTHISSDLERIADYITYIQNGSIVFSGEKQSFLDAYRLVKGGREELTEEREQCLLGVRSYSMGFEGLIHSCDAEMFSGLAIEAPKIDDVIILTNRREFTNGENGHDKCD